MNDVFANLIGLRERVPFIPSSDLTNHEDDMDGLGRIGLLVLNRKRFPVLAKRLKDKLGALSVRMSGDSQMKVQKVVVCTGSRASLVNEFLASVADAYITGDSRYHDARTVEDEGRGKD